MLNQTEKEPGITQYLQMIYLIDSNFNNTKLRRWFVQDIIQRRQMIMKTLDFKICVKELEPRRVKISLVSEFYDITRKQSQVNILHKNKSLGLVWSLSTLNDAWKERLFNVKNTNVQWRDWRHIYYMSELIININDTTTNINITITLLHQFQQTRNHSTWIYIACGIINKWMHH